jgi:hypothetical protein
LEPEAYSALPGGNSAREIGFTVDPVLAALWQNGF